MPRRHHYRRRSAPPAELDMTTFLNLMVVLVPFLLITAVFSRITIVELNLPSAAGGTSAGDHQFRVEVIVRDVGLEVTNGRDVIASLPKLENEYDLGRLTEMMVSLKRDHPNSQDASVLLEPNIEYDHLIQVMDAVRSTALPEDDKRQQTRPTGESMRLALFTDISIGEAP